MEGTLPWSREVCQRFLSWCPNPFLYFNYHNKDAEEIRLTKIITKISDDIILPLKASYHFATSNERRVLAYADVYMDSLLSMEESLIYSVWQDAEVELYGSRQNWSTPQIYKDMWTMLKREDIEVSADETMLSLAYKLKTCIDRKKARDDKRNREGALVFDDELMLRYNEGSLPMQNQIEIDYRFERDEFSEEEVIDYEDQIEVPYSAVHHSLLLEEEDVNEDKPYHAKVYFDDESGQNVEEVDDDSDPFMYETSEDNDDV